MAENAITNAQCSQTWLDSTTYVFDAKHQSGFIVYVE